MSRGMRAGLRSGSLYTSSLTDRVRVGLSLLLVGAVVGLELPLQGGVARASGNYPAVIASDNPAGYWRLGEAPPATTAADTSGHGLNLSYSSSGTTLGVLTSPSAAAINGDPGTAAQFDGLTGMASRSAAVVATTGTWSLEAWIQPRTLPQTAIVAYDGVDAAGSGGFGFGIGGSSGGSGSHLLAYLGATTIDSGYTFPTAGSWYHVVVTRDTSTLRFYVNGAATSGTSTTAPATPSAGFSVGAALSATGTAVDPFTGAVQEVAAYTSVLSPARVVAHYQEGVSPLSAFGTWITSSSAQPPARRDPSATYDGTHHQVVLFGGYPPPSGTGSQLSDTWLFDGSTWTQAKPTVSPTARYGAALAYDAARGNVVLFGGKDATGATSDTWIWNGSNWTVKVLTKSPPKRIDASMVYDASLGYTVLFGGQAAGTPLNDTWKWDGSAWTQLSPSSTPSARSQAAATYDTLHQQVVLFGGTTGGVYDNDTWTYSSSGWTNATPAVAPSARSSSSMFYDATTATSILFGGWNGTSGYQDTWSWNGTTWSQVTATPPGSGTWVPAGAAYDPDSDTGVLASTDGTSPFTYL